jgi:hypothetical protein
MFPARSKILRFAKNLSPSGQRRIKQGGRSKRKKREEGTAVISKGRRLFRETIGLAVAMDEPERTRHSSCLHSSVFTSEQRGHQLEPFQTRAL